MPGRNGQVSRIYAALDALECRPLGLTVAQLTDILNELGHEASKRTVYRDLEALSAAGFPLIPHGEKEDTGTRWILQKLARINTHFVLSARELLALYLARGVLAPLKSTPFYHDLETIFHKIESKLGTKSHQHLQETAQHLQFQPGPRWGLGIDPDTLETVRACCSEKQLLEVNYASASSQDKRTRVLGAHYLYFAQGSLYLVAEDADDHVVKVFSLARMSDALMLDKPYNGELSEPSLYFQGSFGIYRGLTPVHVKVNFAATIAPYIKERRWHESQSIITKSNGAIILSLDVALTPEFLHWVVGFGDKAIVLEPSELRRAVVDSAEKIINQYQLLKAA